MLQSLVASARPVVAGDLDASTADISWLVTAYRKVHFGLFGGAADLVDPQRQGGQRLQFGKPGTRTVSLFHPAVAS
jgi:hypothetical protein